MLRASWSSFAALGLLVLGNGLLCSLVGIRAELEEFDTILTGVVLAFHFNGFIAGLYVVAEGWLNASATNKNRGRLLSIYMVVAMGAIGAGQLLLTVAGRRPIPTVCGAPPNR